MVKIEVGKVYMTGTKHLALVYKHNPDQYTSDSKYSKHTYNALLLRISSPVTCLETFTEEGQYAAAPSHADIVRDATFEELIEYIEDNKYQLSEPTNNKYLESFYKTWKEKNP